MSSLPTNLSSTNFSIPNFTFVGSNSTGASSTSDGLRSRNRGSHLQEADRPALTRTEARRVTRSYLAAKDLAAQRRHATGESRPEGRPRSRSFQIYPSRPDSLRIIDRTQLAGSITGRTWTAGLVALRSGEVENFHLDDVHVVLPIAGTIVTAGKDGRAIASRIDGESIVAQPVHPFRESPVLFHGEENALHRPVVSEGSWVSAGAAHDRHFALGCRDGTIFRGEVIDGPHGERSIRRTWGYPSGSGKPGNWAVVPELPLIQQNQGTSVESANSRRVYGLALLPAGEGSPPALTAACGQALWSTGAHGGKPSVTSLAGLLSRSDEQFPERILGLQGLPAPTGSSVSSLFVLGQAQALWLTARGSSDPLELRHRGTAGLKQRHVSAHWMPDEGAAMGALGQARSGGLTVIQWHPDGSAQLEEWRGTVESRDAGTAWSIDHLCSELLLTGHQNSLVRIWDVRSGSPELDLSLPFGRASGVAADREQMLVIACLADDECRNEGRGGASMAIWDVRKSSELLASTGSPLTSPVEEEFFEFEM